MQIHRFFLNCRHIRLGPAEIRGGVLFRRDRRAGQIGQRQRVACRADRRQLTLKPCIGSPDEHGVGNQTDRHQSAQDDPGPFENLFEAFHRRVPWK